MICFKLFSACYDVYPTKSISHLTTSAADHSVKKTAHISAKSISVTSRTPALSPRTGTYTVHLPSLYPTSQHRRRTTVSKRRHTYQHTRQVYISPNITDTYPHQDSILYIISLNYTLESFLFLKNTFCRAQIAQTRSFLALFSVPPIKYMQTAAGCSTSTKI